jgi:dTMP kinase
MAARRFLTFEGGEGSGKSTLIRGLQEVLAARGHDVVVTREPGGTPLAEAARALVLTPPVDEDWSPVAQALLVNAARRDHIERLIAPALERGAWVLSDRFADSTRVYQGQGGVEDHVLDTLETLTVGDTRPDLTFILDADPAKLQQRRTDRGISDVFENKPLSFHQGIRARFLHLAGQNRDRCVILDALSPIEAVKTAALSVIETRFGAV